MANEREEMMLSLGWETGSWGLALALEAGDSGNHHLLLIKMINYIFYKSYTHDNLLITEERG